MENIQTDNITEEFRKLPESFKVHGRTMNSVERNDEENYAVYDTKDLGTLYYEVFQIRIAKATTIKINGKETPVPKRELLPSDNNFGDWAWTCTSELSKQKAIEKIMKRNANGGKDAEIEQIFVPVTQ